MDYILCGAGKRGKELYSFLKYFLEAKNIGRVIGFIDSNPQLDDIDGVPVYLPEKLEENNGESTYIITPFNNEIIEFYTSRLQGKNYIIYHNLEDLAGFLKMDLTSMRREICAYWHVDNMDDYFDEAELDESISAFWGESSEFKKLFDCLDLTNVIELACGRGRHIKEYVDRSGHVTVVDILQKNIDYCKERYRDNSNISYYKNEGYNLMDLPSDTYTSLFCYDAMVHFEMLDINSYLVDIFRVLKRGGKVLLHHSNFDAYYDGSFTHERIHGRAFMNYKVFAYLALNAGFQVVKQQIIPWGGLPALDCVTLLEKK